MRIWIAVTLLLCACGGASSGAADAAIAACDAAAYPCGPYGLVSGSTIANLTFSGKHDDDGNGNAANDALRSLSLADYHLRPALHALVLVVASETCVPCQNEQPTLLSLHARYGPAVAFVEAIVQGQAGMPADTAVIDAWSTRFSIPFDMTADPAGVLRPYYDASAFPTTLVIRTSDMNLVSFIAGSAGDLQAILDPLTT